jgi:hypothetical protein
VVSRPSCSCVFAEPYNTCLFLQNCCIVTRAGLVVTGGKVLWHFLSLYKHTLTRKICTGQDGVARVWKVDTRGKEGWKVSYAASCWLV